MLEVVNHVGCFVLHSVSVMDIFCAEVTQSSGKYSNTLLMRLNDGGNDLGSRAMTHLGQH